mmetsp:Transcript_16795/g.54932  ORF Transcript_16795/g.54932 Transcript_16795/m.54932 type:complete len:327 (+) Transcript_16795:292-1272(+)
MRSPRSRRNLASARTLRPPGPATRRRRASASSAGSCSSVSKRFKTVYIASIPMECSRLRRCVRASGSAPASSRALDCSRVPAAMLDAAKRLCLMRSVCSDVGPGFGDFRFAFLCLGAGAAGLRGAMIKLTMPASSAACVEASFPLTMLPSARTVAVHFFSAGSLFLPDSSWNDASAMRTSGSHTPTATTTVPWLSLRTARSILAQTFPTTAASSGCSRRSAAKCGRSGRSCSNRPESTTWRAKTLLSNRPHSLSASPSRPGSSSACLSAAGASASTTRRQRLALSHMMLDKAHAAWRSTLWCRLEEVSMRRSKPAIIPGASATAVV